MVPSTRVISGRIRERVPAFRSGLMVPVMRENGDITKLMERANSIMLMATSMTVNG